MPFHVYVLKSQSSGRFYVGHTEHLTRRVFEHNNNHTFSSKNRGPWKLVYSEEFPTRSGAALREQQIKRMKSSQWIDRLVRASR